MIAARSTEPSASSLAAAEPAAPLLIARSSTNGKGERVNRLDLKFLILAALSLVVGVGLGIVMAIRHDFQLAPVHAHLNLLGWASLALFGIVYRIYPELAERRLAAIHFALAAPAAAAFPIGIALAILAERPQLAIVAALMWLGGAILFLVQLIGLLARPAPAALAAAE